VLSLKFVLKISLACVLTAIALAAQAGPVPAGSDDEIRERLKPFGSLCRSGEECGAPGASNGASSDMASDGAADSAAAQQSGEAVYNQFCFVCHATGVSEAPLFADAEAWAPRIEKGMETLMASTVDGMGLMPLKGTCMACSDDELRAAVEYMLEQVQ